MKTLMRLAFLTVTLSLSSVSALAYDYACPMPGAPTEADIPDDVQYFLTKSHVWKKGYAIVSAVKEPNPVSGLPDIKFWFPAPYNLYVYKSDILTHPDYLSLTWVTKCTL